MRTSETLTSFLWEQIVSERMCSARMQHIATSPRLTDRERADMESLVRDEDNHAAWLRERAAAWGERAAYPGTWSETILEHNAHVRTLSPEELVVTIYVPERYAIKTLARQAAIFREEGDPTTAAVYEQVLGEERRHVDVTGAILRRLLSDPECGGRVRDFYHQAVAGGYRQGHYDFLRVR